MVVLSTVDFHLLAKVQQPTAERLTVSSTVNSNAYRISPGIFTASDLSSLRF